MWDCYGRFLQSHSLICWRNNANQKEGDSIGTSKTYFVMRGIFKFYGLACALSWIIWLPLYLPHFGVRALPVLPYHHAIGALGPLMACFTLTALSEGRHGVLKKLRAMVRANSVLWIAVALFSPFVLLLLAAGIHYLWSGVRFHFSAIGKTSEFPYFNVFTYFIYNLFFFGYGEETGWKGYLLPRLQRSYSALTSSIIFTAFWAVWHLPLFFYRPGYVAMDAAAIAGWFFSLLTGSILLTWLFNASRGSILVCAVFHATIDMAFVSGAVAGEVSNYLGFLITIWGIATIFLFGAKNLSRNEKVVI